MTRRFSYAIEPSGKGRPRFSSRGSKKDGDFKLRTHTDKKTASFERQIRDLCRLQMRGAPPATGPLSISVVFRLKRPSTVRRLHPTVTPDLDNLIKAVLDGMNRVAWMDDAQIVEMLCRKEYSESPGISLEMREICAESENKLPRKSRSKAKS